MGSPNFYGADLGGVAVGVDVNACWSDEDRNEYRSMMGDDDLTEDYVDDCLTENEADYVSDLYDVAESFVKDLNNHLYSRFFMLFLDGESPLEIKLKLGYHSGFEMTVEDNYGFYRDQSKFIEAQAEDWAKYYEDESDDFTAAEWAAHVQKAIDFANYALVRFAWAKGLYFVSGGWCGGTSKITAEDVRGFARFKKYGAKLAVQWAEFCRKYGAEYNRFGL